MPAWLRAPEGSLFLSWFCLPTYHLLSFIRNFYYHVFFFYNTIDSSETYFKLPIETTQRTGGQITVSLWCNISVTFYPSPCRNNGTLYTYCLHFSTHCDLKITLVGIPLTSLIKRALSHQWSHLEKARGCFSEIISLKRLTIDTLCSLPGPFTPLVMWFPESQTFAAFEATSPQIPSPSPPTSKYLDDWGHSLWLSYPTMI